MKKHILLITLLVGIVTNILAQADFGTRQPHVITLAQFGGLPNDGLDDSYALIKASKYIENKWKANGDTLTQTDPPNINYATHYVRLEIPSGTYNVGKEVSLMNGQPNDTLFKTYYSSTSAITKKLYYSKLYNDNGKNDEAILIEPYNLNSCYYNPFNVWAPQRYYTVNLFSVSNASYTGNNLIDGIEIVGTGSTKPIFKYADNIHVGWADTLGNPLNAKIYGSVWCSHGWDIMLGSKFLFTFNKCKNVSMNNIEMDGNVQNAIYMGSGWDGFQGGSVGIDMNAKNVTLKNLYIHHMQVDGIMLVDKDCNYPTYCVMDSITSEYNRRQAFTWSVGDSLIVTNSKFNHTGRAISLTQPNTTLGSAPQAGVDFEYEGQCSTNPTKQIMVQNGYFTDCEFINNAGACLNDYNGNSNVVRTENINFKKCTIQKNDGFGIWMQGNKITYDSCKFYCRVTNIGFGDVAGLETKFLNCEFEDKPYNNVAMQNGLLLEIEAKRTLFKNCTFKVNDKNRALFWINRYSSNKPKEEKIIMEDCNFLHNNEGITSSSIISSIFKNNNTFENTFNASYSLHSINSMRSIIEGNTTPCNPSSLNLKGQIKFIARSETEGIHDTLSIGNLPNGVNGYANLNIEKDAVLFVENWSRIDIGLKSKINIKKKGTIHKGGNYQISGSFIAEDSSYICAPAAGYYAPNGNNSLMYVSKYINPNGYSFNPIWDTVLAINSNWWYIGNNPYHCIQGNNSSLSNVACSPLFNNISTSNSFNVLYNLKDIKCKGNSTGKLIFNIHNAQLPLSYSLNGGAVITLNNIYDSIVNLSAGLHLIQFYDNNCINSFNFNINEPNSNINLNNPIATTNVTCNGGNNGSIYFSATGGTGTITYSKDNGATFQSNGNFTGLTANTYTIVAKDGNGCTVSSTISITQPTQVNITNLSSTPINCFGETSTINVSANGGTGAIEYKLNNGTYQSSNIFANNSVGTYTITTKDTNSCTATSTIIINQPTAVTITSLTSTPILCNGDLSTITILATGGTGSLEYKLNNGTYQSSNIFANISSGTYIITTKDANSCTATSTIIINQPTAVTITSLTSTPIFCNGDLSTITILATGGTGTFSYNLQPTNITNATGLFNGLAPNTYTVTSSDANGCSTTSTVLITEPTQVVYSTFSSTDVTCNGLNNGTISAIATGGTGTFSYYLQPTNITNATGLFNGLAPNTYTVTSSDANGCSKTSITTITEPQALTTSLIPTHVLCFGNNTGAITNNVSGGTLPYIYSWSNGATTKDITNVIAGTYTVTVTDNNGCSITSTATITEPSSSVTMNAPIITNISCSATTSNPDGNIILSGSGGVNLFSYTLQNGTYNNSNLGGVFSNVADGTYTATVTDDNGCTATSIVTINKPQADMCCSPFAQTLVTMPNIILLNNPLASDVITNYNNNNAIVSNKTFYISGTFSIDQTITFDNCTLYFTPTGKVQLNGGFNGNTIEFNTTNNTQLLASCDWWEGVISNTAMSKIAIDGSTIKNAKYGIDVSNNAELEIANNQFIDNGDQGIGIHQMTANPNNSFILNNSFTSTNMTGLYTKTKNGIVLEDVKDIRIGDANSTNTFDNLETGINIHSWTNGTSNIEIYNSAFSNINNTSTAYNSSKSGIVENCYTNEIGAGIFADLSNQPTQNLTLTVKNTQAQGYEFLNCDKAIVTNGVNVIAENLKTTDCLLGIMCSSPTKRNYDIKNNKLYGTHIGIEVNNRVENCSIEDNEIETGLHFAKTINNSNYHPKCPNYLVPIGIKTNFQGLTTATTPTTKYTINNNVINVKAKCGMGILNGYGNNEMESKGNTITLSTSSLESGLPAGNFNQLVGMQLDECKGSSIEDNGVYGNSDEFVFIARNTKGIVFNESPNCNIHCNKAKYTRWGFYGWGNCNTDKDKITMNKFNANNFPWYFMDGANVSSFGNVGDGNTNNGNDFLYNAGVGAIDWRNKGNYNPSKFKVFRESIIAIPDNIFTSTSNLNPLLNETGSLNMPTANYGIIVPSNILYTDPCADSTFIIDPNDDYNIHNADYEHNLEVANEGIDYVNFPIVGGWIDKLQLFQQLSQDSILRNSDPELLTFYNLYYSQTIGNIYSTDEALDLLTDGSQNSIDFMTHYLNSVSRNEQIISSNEWEENERLINEINLLNIRYGIDSITDEHKQFLETLSYSCPYMQGSSVYKARVLWNNFRPDAIFDDRVLCIPQAQGKSTEGGGVNNNEIDIDSLSLVNMSNIPVKNVPLTIQNNTETKTVLQVYPNPATTKLIVEYNCKGIGNFVIINALGQEVYSENLLSSASKKEIDISHLYTGVYTYKCKIEGCINETGKIKIIR